ncbi:MAG: carboxypeptidase regulatory-like domain-containing protein [Clostridiaceae bacterium]|nr:carboxypeptidase regulatory-like domain-containing protein [Clostridiaceae bacterium]
MSIIKDEFIPAQSIRKKINGITETIRLDLTLFRNPHINSGTVMGTVRDANGKPVSDAVIIVLDETRTVIASTYTGNDGKYNFPIIPSEIDYRAYSQAPGFLLSDAVPFKLGINQRIEIDFTLIADNFNTCSIIAGEVLNSCGLPVKSASVELYLVTETEPKLLSITFSNDIGQFVFRVTDSGSYFLKINATGFFSEYFPVEIKKPKSIINVNIVLEEDLKASKGIIMGVICDCDEMPLANADVILYRVGTDQSPVPVAYTRTNHEGIYLFINVPQGEYLVNSNRSVIVD